LVGDVGETVEYEGRNISCLGSVVTQCDLGAMARGTRGNVNRALKSWEKRGWIAMQGRSILLLNREKLENLSSESL
jgi:CRP-like cAMP-binding protein